MTTLRGTRITTRTTTTMIEPTLRLPLLVVLVITLGVLVFEVNLPLVVLALVLFQAGGLTWILSKSWGLE